MISEDYRNFPPTAYPLLTRMPKITKRLVDSLATKPEGDVVVWDAELKGFGVRVKPSGAGSYCLQYRTKHGRSRRLTFGRVGVITPEQARNEARRLLIKIHEGADPAADRQEARKALTVADLCQEHLEAARAGLVLTRRRQRKASSTISNEVGWINRHVLPLIGAIPANELTRPIVQKMHDAIASGQTSGDFKTKARGRALVKGGATVAARVVEMLGGIWTWGEKRGLVVGPNPANGVQKHKPEPRDRTLDVDELKRLGDALREHEKTQPAAASALRLIALTGLRREEACGLRWREIDAAVQALRLEATKTGRSMRPIGKAALDVLSTVPRSSEFVFPSRDGAQSADLKKRIASIFDTAELNDARSHALRRTFGSIAADEGYSDSTIAELLGHAKVGVTARHYIRRPDAALVAAADRVSARIAAMLNVTDGASPRAEMAS